MAMPTHIVAVGGIVEDDHDNVLLVKTIHRGWEFPGGQVEVGENLVAALIREIKEESGIDTTVSHLLAVSSNTGTYLWHDGVTDIPTKVMFDFVCKATGGECTSSEETTESRWVLKEEVLDFVETPAIRARYQTYLDFNGDIQYLEYVTKPTFKLKQQRKV